MVYIYICSRSLTCLIVDILLAYYIASKIASADLCTCNLFKDVETALIQLEDDSVGSRNSQVLAGGSVMNARV